LRVTKLPKKPTTRASGGHRSSSTNLRRARPRSTGAASVSNGLCTTVHLRAGESRPGLGAAKRETEITRSAAQGAT
jgi:hypothetical protein